MTRREERRERKGEGEKGKGGREGVTVTMTATHLVRIHTATDDPPLRPASTGGVGLHARGVGVIACRDMTGVGGTPRQAGRDHGRGRGRDHPIAHTKGGDTTEREGKSKTDLASFLFPSLPFFSLLFTRLSSPFLSPPSSSPLPSSRTLLHLCSSSLLSSLPLPLLHAHTTAIECCRRPAARPSCGGGRKGRGESSKGRQR
mmetsp:Transcript_50034/g.128781  ORF Transcript_50034/g.128781 Transcript_50034/m.128781 type:complete len:201 (-) Transcript_50034:1940-2542(-)